MSEKIGNLIEVGFSVRGILTDNHPAYVNASSLATDFNSESKCCINHPQNHVYNSVASQKVYKTTLNRKKKIFFRV